MTRVLLFVVLTIAAAVVIGKELSHQFTHVSVMAGAR